ncbi:conserved hypothetical protein [Paecilomyces variotii No. 5]|uniref:SGNH hydrolase-type esterase domain-containing protein n=1 Tax=Byssochlamys spectabilis (strain No. 5 / NBRC 109023) TaxID=1356009 RepID=V5HX87_BYSSN|nr:conserved hypothetical protein [Paecilomyces variotii No. 5]
MRFLSKFHILSILAACSILYSAWVLTSRRYQRIAPVGSGGNFQVASDFEKRLVVFGDSWSDDNAKDAPVRVWTDWLCSMFSCHQENLAQTAESSQQKYGGSVVDNTGLEDLSSGLGWYEAPLADLGSQMDQWLEAEQTVMQSMPAEAVETRHNNTIISVGFGVWDLWNLVGKDYDDAKESVVHSVTIIFERLNELSERWGTKDMRVILTMAPDVTFFPAFRPTPETQKDTVKLVEYWNNFLRSSAEEWDCGTIYLFDTNEFMLDQLRDWQLFAAGMEDEHGLGKNENPGWEDVTRPCVQRNSTFLGWTEKQCEHPDKYLFWDDMHLGPSAHRIMGEEIFHGIETLWLNETESTSAVSGSRGAAV